MIKSIIFDLDGVLVDTKDIHFHALNDALKINNINHQITYNDHVQIFDGLPTKTKLEILLKQKILKKRDFKNIIKSKNFLTNEKLKKNIKFNKAIQNIFKILHKKFIIMVATNAVRETLEICLKNLKIKKYVSFNISNEDVKKPKPHPEIYMRCMLQFSLMPSETLIIEDSYNGRESARNSGAYLMPINELNQVNLKNITSFVKSTYKSYDNLNKKKFSWEDDNLNILIPMAGHGSRFVNAGYTFPKPLIEIHGKPMIQWVIENLNIKANYIFIILKEHQEKYNIKSLLKMLTPSCDVIELNKVTEGAACTALLSKKIINNNKSLLISNSDQFVEMDIAKVMYNFSSKKIDGGILTFNSLHPKWSYAKVNKLDHVLEVAEKKVISNHATTGHYFWKKGKDFVRYAEKMIKLNKRVNNEFYICPVYNEAISDKKKIMVNKIDKMWGLGTPEDLNYFLDKYQKK